MYKVIIFMVILLFLNSCATEKKVKKNNELPKLKEIKIYDLQVGKFPKKDLLLKDINFIAYFNLEAIKKIKDFKQLVTVLSNNYFINNNIKSFYITFSDIYKSQELLLFLNQYQIKIDTAKLKSEQIANKTLFKTSKTDNQEFGFINFDDNTALYGDTALVKELFNIYDKKVNSISDERYGIFINSDFLKSNAEFKLFFMPNDDYKSLLSEFSEQQIFFKLLFINLSYIFLEVKLQEDNILNINLTISKKVSIDKLFTFLNKQYKLLLTLNGPPYSTLNTKNIAKNINLFSSLKINKKDENSLVISLKIEAKNLNKYFRIIKNLLK